MSDAYQVYFPPEHDLPIAKMLEGIGMEIRSQPKRLGGGKAGWDHTVMKGDHRVGILEAPPSPDGPYRFFLILAPRHEHELLFEVVSVLKALGATEHPS